MKRRAEEAKKKAAEEKKRQIEERRQAAEKMRVRAQAAAAMSAAEKEKSTQMSTGNGNNFFSNLFGIGQPLKSGGEAVKREARTKDAPEKGEEQRRLLEERKLAADAKKQATKAKRAEIKRETKRPKDASASVKRSTTISLFGLFSSPRSSPTPSDQTSTAVQPKKVIAAPRRVPTLSKYRKNRDGSISAYIFNSPSFQDGEMISTSPITSQILPGAVVETSSGSKYFLDPGRDQVLREFQAKQRDEARSAAMAGKAGGNRDASVATKTQQAKPKRSATIPLFRGTTISLFGGTTAKKKVPPQAQGPTTDPPPGSKPRATLLSFRLEEVAGRVNPIRDRPLRLPMSLLECPE